MTDQTWLGGEEPIDLTTAYRLTGTGKPYALGDGRTVIAELSRVKLDAASVRNFARSRGLLLAPAYPADESYETVAAEAFSLRQVMKLCADFQLLDGTAAQRASAVRSLRGAEVRNWLEGRWPDEPSKGTDREIIDARRRWVADRVSERLGGISFRMDPATFAVVPQRFPNLLTALWWHAARWIESGNRIALCDHCHEIFQPKHGNQRFCVTQHSQAYRDAKRYEQRARSRQKGRRK